MIGDEDKDTGEAMRHVDDDDMQLTVHPVYPDLCVHNEQFAQERDTKIGCQFLFF